MNFLAHLHIADITATSTVGAVMGDFIKGSDWRQLPAAQQLGLLLHRQVDIFTDHHPCVIQARRKFTKTRQRFTGIVVDMVFDHLLAKNWQTFHSEALHIFSQRQYHLLSANEPHWPDSMVKVCRQMAKTDWLTSYADEQTLVLALERIGNRLSVKDPFAHAYTEWQNCTAEHSALFQLFYRDLLKQLPRLMDNAESRQTAGVAD